MNDGYWLGRHIVVTGGTSGIGLATTRQLLGAGALVTSIGLDDDYAAQLRAESNQNLVVATADICDEEQLRTAIEHGRDKAGPVQNLVCCAGIVRPQYFAELSIDDHRRHMEVNYFGALNAVRACLPDLTAATRASITCVSSAAGFLGVFGYGAYSPTKFAVSGLCEVLRQELKPQGITVTVVYPPDVDTPMLAGESPQKPRELRALSSGGNVLSPQRVAKELLNGTMAGRARVIPGLSTRVLRFAAGATPRLLAWYMDAVIAKARKTPAGLADRSSAG